MNTAMQLVVSVFVLTIGEILIYEVVMASELPAIFKVLAIVAIPAGLIIGFLKRFTG